jgi:predicted ATP-grasp superfamily ATP-dependent carboligase
MLGVAERMGVEVVVSLGSLLDAAPHTRDIRISGVATTKPYRDELAALGVHESGYQGPAGIHTALLEACVTKGLPYLSLWGHCPHYVNITPNPRVSCALLAKLQEVVALGADLGELRESAQEFDVEVSKAVANMPEVRAYVEQLEQSHDAASPSAEMPSPESMVAEMEEFLRNRRRGRGGVDAGQ